MRKTEEILNTILDKRGIRGEESISEFLSDRPQKTYDPFLLLNMNAGVDLLLSEIKSGKKICIYGDYDADGVTSVCILSHVIGMLTDNLTYYIPSRFNEGYGLNKDAVAAIRKDGTDLLVTVDCGSVSYDEVEYAKELGMKVIVTDHHRIDERKADCILINPKQEECRYPFKELAGCGVAFKMAQALQQKAGLPKSVINDVLDLTAVGTVADIVSLTDENRTIVKYGLNRINSGRRLSLKRLTEAISLKEVSSESIAFGIAPHINAAGRMASAYEAVKLFMTDDERVIEEQIRNLTEFNRERKKKQETAYNQYIDTISDDENFIVLDMPDIHEGIAGVLAGNIKERTGKPVIIVTPSDGGYLKGTGRSIDGVDIHSLLQNHSGLFLRFGGHKSACGFMMSRENLPALKEGLEKDMLQLLSENEDLFLRKTDWEMDIAPEELTLELAKTLDRLQPFGQGNPKPLFRMRGAVPSQVRFLGDNGNHAKFTAVSEAGGRADCIFFKKAQDKTEELTGGKPADIIGSIGIQSWRGRESVQFVVEEIL